MYLPHHENARQHGVQGSRVYWECGVPHGAIRNTGALRLKVEHIIPLLHTFRTTHRREQTRQKRKREIVIRTQEIHIILSYIIALNFSNMTHFINNTKTTGVDRDTGILLPRATLN